MAKTSQILWQNLFLSSQNGDALKCQIVVFCQFVLLYHSPVKNPPVYICAACVRVDDLFLLIQLGGAVKILQQFVIMRNLGHVDFALAAAKPNPSQQSC
jgi:sRNA-binding regulator protein Hfq